MHKPFKTIDKLALLLIGVSIYIPFLCWPLFIVFGISVTGKLAIALGYFALYMFPIQVITYLVLVIKNSSFNGEKKILWVLLILGGDVIFMPVVYWLKYIWKSERKDNHVENGSGIIENKVKEHTVPKKSSKILIFIFTLLPYILGAAALLLVIITEPRNNAAFVLGILAYILCFCLLGFYVYNVFNNKFVAANKRALWTIALIIGGGILAFLYWYLYILREPKET